MFIGNIFRKASRTFSDELTDARIDLKAMAFRLKNDARCADSFGFYALGSILYKLTDRKQDDIDDRQGMLKSYAERAVWLTHFLTDPEKIKAVKEDILYKNIDGITVKEIDEYLKNHSHDLPFHNIQPEQRETMLSNLSINLP